MHRDIEKVLVSSEKINEILIRLGNEITNDYKGRNPLFLGLLKGCIPFMPDLLKHINLKVEIIYMDVSSYHGGIESSGDLKINYDATTQVKGRDVILVEDIVDTGRTVNTVVELLKYRGVNSVKVVTLLDKPEGRIVPSVPDYVGITIPKEFVVGYGLDYNELYRNLPYIGVLKPEIYNTVEKEEGEGN